MPTPDPVVKQGRAIPQARSAHLQEAFTTTTSLAKSVGENTHTLSLLDGEIVEESDLGSMRRVTTDNLPILQNVSIKRVVLNPGAMRTPHWHANADELTHCVSGTTLVSILDTGSKFSTSVLTAGQMFHAASGSLHHIENIGGDVAEFIIAFRHERPEDFGFGATLGAFSDAVLGNTYDLPSSDFATIRRTTVDHKLAARNRRSRHPGGCVLQRPAQVRRRSPTPHLNDLTGQARFARDQNWPALKEISMYSLRVTEDGMRELHWHPATGEMGYLQHGDARMTVMNPDGTLDT